MKKLLTLIAVAGSFGVCQGQNYTATLTSTQEVPANDLTSVDGTYAFGNFSLSGSTLSVTAGFYGNSVGDPTFITVNDAPPTANGPVLFDLTINNDETTVNGGLIDGSFAGSGTLTPPQITDLQNGDLYVNLQTAAVSSPGEVRGQITATPEPATMALMGVGSLVWMVVRRRKV